MSDKTFIETPRLQIKHINMAELYLLGMQQKDPQVMEFFGGPRDDIEILKVLNKYLRHFKQHGYSMGAVFKRDTHEFIGRAGLVKLDFEDNSPYVEMGYFLSPEYYNQGYATEIATHLIKYAFETLKVTKVYATIDPKNEASRKVSEKLGMRIEKEDIYQSLNKKVIYYFIENNIAKYQL